MTDEQINRAIAEACPDKFRMDEGWWYYQYAENCWMSCCHNSICQDLNAMHEAAKSICDPQYFAYVAELARAWANCRVHATARQRAEAFLRTLGKWEEAQ